MRKLILALVGVITGAAGSVAQDDYIAIGRRLKEEAAKQAEEAERLRREAVADSSDARRSARERVAAATRRAEAFEVAFRATDATLSDAARHRLGDQQRALAMLSAALDADSAAMREETRRREAELKAMLDGLAGANAKRAEQTDHATPQPPNTPHTQLGHPIRTDQPLLDRTALGAAKVSGAGVMSPRPNVTAIGSGKPSDPNTLSTPVGTSTGRPMGGMKAVAIVADIYLARTVGTAMRNYENLMWSFRLHPPSLSDWLDLGSLVSGTAKFMRGGTAALPDIGNDAVGSKLEGMILNTIGAVGQSIRQLKDHLLYDMPLNIPKVSK